jgi:succinoglycan biosynthesis protein ExoL
MLIVSSPDFMNNYFKTQQQYSGPWYLLENKVAAGQWQSDINTDPPSAPPWVIGWFGRLRCRKSLDILSMIAERLGDHVFIDIRGLPSEQDLPVAAINEAVARHPNMRYGGVYSSPCDLSHVYGKVHFSWCIDFLDTGTNSDWLLPNRLYEGGLFAVPAFTRAGTAAARKVEADGIGVAFDEPLEEGIGKFLKGLRFTDYESLRGRVRELPRSKFVDSQDTKELLLALFNRQNLAAGCTSA